MPLSAPVTYQKVTAMQEALLLESKLTPSANIVQWIWHSPFHLDQYAVEQSCVQLMQRHALLRSRFLWADEQCTLIDDFDLAAIGKNSFTLQYQAGFANDMEDAALLLEPYLAQDRYAGFDTESAPLFRCHLLTLNSGECIVVFTFHQAIIDNQSFIVFIDDFIGFYKEMNSAAVYSMATGANVKSLHQQTKPLTINHSVGRQDRNTASSEEAESYWRQLLAGFSEPNLPKLLTVSSDTANLTKHSHIVRFLTESTKQQLLELANQCHVGLDVVIQAAWAIMLQRYCHTDDIVFGVTLDTRDDNTPTNIVGMFDNTLPVRARINEAVTLAELLKILHHQQNKFVDTPLTQIQSFAEMPAGERLMATAINVEYDTLTDVLDCHGEQWPKGQFHWVYESTFALSGHVFYGETVSLRIDFDVDQYDAAAAQQILRHFNNILTAMTVASLSVNDINMLDDTDIKQLERCAGVTKQSQGQCVHLDIIRHAQQYSEDIAVRIGEQCLSYGELNQRSHLLAHDLIQQGVGADVIVGVCIPRSFDFIIAILAVLRAGGAYLPLESEDPPERLISVLKDAKVNILLTQSAVSPSLLSSPYIANMACVFVDTWQPTVAIKQSVEQASNSIEVSPSNAAYVIYTSGTTGKPKGVVIEHQQLSHHCQAMGDVIACQQGAHVLQFASCAFDVSVEEIFTTLTRGGCLVLREPSMLASASSFFAALSHFNITIANLPTAFWGTLVDAANNDNELLWPLCVQTLIVGGEQITRATYDQFREQDTQHIRFINGYGPTETTITSTYAECLPQGEKDDNHTVFGHRDAVPIGKPILGASHYILDHHKRLCPPRVSGHLYIGGAGVAREYLYREELTLERFQQLSLHARLPPERYYATGDRVCNDGEYWYFIGRLDHQIKIRGYRVELGEIESVLREHSNVKTALVELNPLRPDSLVAFIASPKKPKKLINYLKQQLPKQLPHYMVPATIIVLHDFPLTRSGKLDRNKLKQMLESYSDNEDNIDQQKSLTERQSQLMLIWKELLSVPHLSLNDSFFELGGHSLLAVKMFSEIERSVGVAVPVKGFFSDPTLQRLDDMIEEVLACELADNLTQPPSAVTTPIAEEVGSLHALQEGGEGCPLYCICGVELYQNLANMLGEQQPTYGIFLPVEEQMVASFSESGKLYTLPSVEEMAAAYVTVIREHQPFGPYKLAGLSFGGILAYEVAQQLTRDGEVVESLVLLDSFVPLKRGKIGVNQLLAMWKRFRMGQLNFFSRAARKCVRKIRSWVKAKRLQYMVSGIANKLDDVDFELFRSLAYRKVSSDYGQSIRAYTGNVIVVHAQDGHTEAEGVNAADHGWGDLVNGDTQVISVPGDHTGILKVPNVAVLAEKIKANIESTQYCGKHFQAEVDNKNIPQGSQYL